MTVEIYTDGACNPNPGRGGWGAILVWRGQEREISGYSAEATNNQMELMAVVEGLRALKRPGLIVEIFTDSKYVRNGMMQWLAKWEKNGWRTAKGPVKNKELWMELRALMSEHQVTCNWIRGHAGHPMNERADRLATTARRNGNCTFQMQPADALL